MTSGSETPKRHILNGIIILRKLAGSHTLGGLFLFTTNHFEYEILNQHRPNQRFRLGLKP